MSDGEVEVALRATLDVPFECSFRKAGSMNSLPTYKAPPVPTIQGLIYSAMGRPSLIPHSYKGKMEKEEKFREEVQEECRFGIKILESGVTHEGLRQRHKTAKNKHDKQYKTHVANGETLISPQYRVYVGGDADLVKKMSSALEDPERLLYLGRSDDLVDIRDIDVLEIERKEEEKELDCVVPNATGEPSLLPVEPDKRDGRSTKPAKLKTVSVDGGEVDSYYQFGDGEEFVFIT
jgi:CRISPR-associated protein Cas5 subtype I-B